MKYNPYKRIDNEYYQPWKVGDKVWFEGVKYRIIEVDNSFNKRNRRQARKFYWLEDIKKNKQYPMRRTAYLVETGQFINPAYSKPYSFIGHGLAADELSIRND